MLASIAAEISSLPKTLPVTGTGDSPGTKILFGCRWFTPSATRFSIKEARSAVNSHPIASKIVVILTEAIAEDYSLHMKNGLGTTLSRLPGPVLITGHTGFKGAWLTILLAKLGIPTVGYSLEPEKGSLFQRAEFTGRIPEVFSDIRNPEALESFIKLHKPSGVIHMAAQPLVLASYENPFETFDINVMGTANLLETSFKHEFIQGIVVVTTDKVYKNDNSGRKFIETDPLEGKDPYSASKVGTEAVVAAWQQISKTQGGPKVVSVRAGNVIGGGDFAENRIVPDLVRSILMKKQDVEIRNPESTRPWQHVLDPLTGYILALEATLNGRSEKSYNFAPDGENLSVKEVAESFISLSGQKVKLIAQNPIKPLEALTLNLDATKAKKELMWKCFWSQSESIRQSFEWWNKVINLKISPVTACNDEISYLMQNLSLRDEADHA
jgi:CDP-glucose 4,6-dehydratase